MMITLFWYKIVYDTGEWYVPVIRCKKIGDLIESLNLMECDRWLH